MRYSAASVRGWRICGPLSAALAASSFAATSGLVIASPAVTLSSSVAAPEHVSLGFLKAPAAAPINCSASLAARLEPRKVQSASVAARPTIQSQSLDWAVSQRQPDTSVTGRYQRGRNASVATALARPPAAISLGRSDAGYRPTAGMASLQQASTQRSGNAALTTQHHVERRQAVFSTASVIGPTVSYSQSQGQLNLSSGSQGAAFPYSSPVGAIAVPGVGLR